MVPNIGGGYPVYKSPILGVEDPCCEMPHGITVVLFICLFTSKNFMNILIDRSDNFHFAKTWNRIIRLYNHKNEIQKLLKYRTIHLILLNTEPGIGAFKYRIRTFKYRTSNYYQQLNRIKRTVQNKQSTAR